LVFTIRFEVDLVQMPRAVEHPVELPVVGQVGADAVAQDVILVFQDTGIAT
jgi:hypothetical protein